MTTGTEIEIAVGAVILLAGATAALLRKPRDPSIALWAPLAQRVGGTTRQNVMTGTLDTMPLRARIVGDGSEGNPYAYELTLTPGPQGQNWSLTYTGQKFLGTGDKTWRVKSRDETLASRLTEAGAVDAIQGWATLPEINYNAKSGYLQYRDKTEGGYALPSPEQFDTHLALMKMLAALQRQCNTP